jgi:hypothetical protein
MGNTLFFSEFQRNELIDLFYAQSDANIAKVSQAKMG